MRRQAKDRAEYDQATASIEWFKECAREAADAGDPERAQRIAVALEALSRMFVLPDPPDTAETP